MKKSLIALLVAVFMVVAMISASAEPYQADGELVPAEVTVPKATVNVLDGAIDAAYGEAKLVVTGAGRSEDEKLINPRDSFADSDEALAVQIKWYFAWDEEYFYIAADVNKPYASEHDEYSNWGAGTDFFQIYFGNDFADPWGGAHLGLGFNGNSDASEIYVNVFEPSMPDTLDNATLNEMVIASISTNGLSTIYEVAIPLEDAVGIAPVVGEEIYFSGALFTSFDGQPAFQVGQGVFWADKDLEYCPLLILGDAVAVEEPVVEEPAEEPAEEEPAVEEPAEEEPTVEEPAEEEPVVDEPTPAPTPAPSNPSTADVSVIFYALAALSAVGGISVFKRK